MQSRTKYLASMAPLMVTFASMALACPARAEGDLPIPPQYAMSSPLDAVAGSLPLSLYLPAHKDVSATPTSQVETAPAPAVEEEIAETPASVYSPAHLQIKDSEPKIEEPATPQASIYSPSHLQIAALEKQPEETASQTAESADKALVAAQDAPLNLQPSEPPMLDLRGLVPDSNGWNGTEATQANQTTEATVNGAATVNDTELAPRDIAQSVPTDTMGEDNRDYDLTPVSLPRRTPQFNRLESMKYSALYFLPNRMFFSAVIDNSLRLETNVFQTASHNKPDMIYRILPDVTLGYALTRKTRVSANYFFLRDQYTKYSPTLNRNFHSVGFQVDQDIYTRGRTNVTLGFFGRALFVNPDVFNDVFFNDLIPSITATHQVGYSGIVYGSILGQIRFREMLSQFQEGDQFYSAGYVHRKGRMTALCDVTFNSNFGNSNLRQGHNNQVFILTQELASRLPLITHLPLQAYVRCQEIFNIGANASPGYAGFNFRVFGGFRLTLTKPAIFEPKLASK